MSKEINGTLLLEREAVEEKSVAPDIVMTRTAVKDPEPQTEVYTGAVPEVKNRPVYAFFKRLADFVLSFLASVVLLIPMAIVALTICIKDPGNPFYLQTRVGKDGNPIKILKFRTMRKGADKLENMLTPEQLEEYKREYKLDDDPRLIGYKKAGDGKTCFGARLRQLSIDELPQIVWNVCLKGDMSLVGPRPILQEELERYYTPEQQKALLSVKPGLTGYWQAYARNEAKYARGGKTTNGVVLHREYEPAVGYKDSASNRQGSAAAQRCEVTPKPLYDFIKRAFDIVVSLICLTVGLPVYLIMILAVVIDDPGNPFFVQDRVGKNGKVFKMVKFRSMRKDAEQIKVNLADQNEYASVHFKMENDPRVTRVGKFLRKTSLDETPQVLNLLTGSMTVIGPRPFIPSEQAQLPDDRLRVKPGLSCYWQLEDTTKMSDEEQLELDYRYIRERGVRTDSKIIFATIASIFKGKNC